MTDWSFEDGDAVYSDHVSLPRKIFARTVPVLAAMSFSALIALRVAGGLAGDLIDDKGASHQAVAPEAAAPAEASAPQEASAAPAPEDSGQVAAQASPYGALFAPEGAYVGSPTLADARPIGPSFSPLQSDPIYPPDATEQPAPQVAEAEAPQAAESSAPQVADAAPMPQARPQDLEETSDAPIPPARPAELGPRRVAEAEAPRTAASRRESPRFMVRSHDTTTVAKTDPRSFFDKMFGGSEEKGSQLAYASPEGGALKLSRGSTDAARPVAEGGTAIYDISSATVFLPNGEKLEAHSGLGPYFDDPEHVNLRMKGATPPATYNLTLRESLFHGVQALRLTPIDSNVHGRSGLLAHTFMLGQRGDSNGCVSFRNYRAFLNAYMRGEVRKLKVVASR